eukprot:2054739-Amphidinium_carterae.1
MIQAARLLQPHSRNGIDFHIDGFFTRSPLALRPNSDLRIYDPQTGVLFSNNPFVPDRVHQGLKGRYPCNTVAAHLQVPFTSPLSHNEECVTFQSWNISCELPL